MLPFLTCSHVQNFDIFHFFTGRVHRDRFFIYDSIAISRSSSFCDDEWYRIDGKVYTMKSDRDDNKTE